MKRRIWVILALTVPLAIFFVARKAANKRPIVIGQRAGASGLQFSPDGKRMLSYGKSNVSSWILRERHRQATWKSGLSYVFSPDGQSLAATGSSYNSIDATRARTVISGVVCDASTGQARVKFSDSFAHPPTFQDDARSPIWSADGSEIWVLSRYHLRRFDARSGQLLGRVQLFALREVAPFMTTLLLPDLSFVVSSRENGIEFRDVKTGKIVRSWPIAKPMPNVTAMVQGASPDARWLAVGFDSNAAGATRIYRIADAKFWEMPIGSAPFVGFSADSRWALFADDETFLARDANTGREIWSQEIPYAQSCFLAPDSRHIYNVDRQGVIRRWEAH